MVSDRMSSVGIIVITYISFTDKVYRHLHSGFYDVSFPLILWQHHLAYVLCLWHVRICFWLIHCLLKSFL